MIVRASFPDLQLASMLPALDELIFNRFNRHPEQFSKLFRVMTSDRAIEQTSEIAGLGTFHEISENGAMRYDQPAPGFAKTYEHAQYGLGFRISKVMVDDDRFSIINKMSSELGRSAKETIELTAALIFNRAFDAAYAGPDGKALCATDHPLIRGGVQANRPAADADIDPASLEIALTDFRRMKDHSGKRIRLVPRLVVVAPENEFAVSEILKGHMRSDTANNTVNAFKHRDGLPSFDKLFVYEYLTDPDAWFILADKEDTELRFYWREKPSSVHAVDFETRAIKTAMWYRHSVGFNSFYGVYGCPGA